MSSREYLRRRRRELSDEQGGRCWWCKCEMTPVVANGTKPPDTMLTLDHLFDKLHPRRTICRDGERRYVAACFKCNQLRSGETSRRRTWPSKTDKPRRRNGSGRSEFNDHPNPGSAGGADHDGRNQS